MKGTCANGIEQRRDVNMRDVDIQSEIWSKPAMQTRHRKRERERERERERNASDAARCRVNQMR